MRQIFFTIFLLTVLANEGDSLYCYRCNSNHPGCGTPLNWLWYWGETCPEYDDKCVKIIERKGAETIITRECLSSVRSFRTDIPADHYEGCRPAAKDVRLGHYVNNSIHQLDIHRDYYDEVTWCFCYFDHRCNSAEVTTVSILLIMLETVYTILNTLKLSHTTQMSFRLGTKCLLYESGTRTDTNLCLVL